MPLTVNAANAALALEQRQGPQLVSYNNVNGLTEAHTFKAADLFPSLVVILMNARDLLMMNLTKYHGHDCASTFRYVLFL